MIHHTLTEYFADVQFFADETFQVKKNNFTEPKFSTSKTGSQYHATYLINYSSFKKSNFPTPFGSKIMDKFCGEVLICT